MSRKRTGKDAIETGMQPKSLAKLSNDRFGFNMHFSC